MKASEIGGDFQTGVQMNHFELFLIYQRAKSGGFWVPLSLFRTHQPLGTKFWKLLWATERVEQRQYIHQFLKIQLGGSKS